MENCETVSETHLRPPSTVPAHYTGRHWTKLRTFLLLYGISLLHSHTFLWERALNLAMSDAAHEPLLPEPDMKTLRFLALTEPLFQVMLLPSAILVSIGATTPQVIDSTWQEVASKLMGFVLGRIN